MFLIILANLSAEPMSHVHCTCTTLLLQFRSALTNLIYLKWKDCYALVHKWQVFSFYVLMSAATTVTTWDMYDTFSSTDQEETMDKPIAEKDDYAEAVVDSSRGTEKSVSMGSTTSTGKDEGHMQSLMLMLHYFFH